MNTPKKSFEKFESINSNSENSTTNHSTTNHSTTNSFDQSNSDHSITNSFDQLQWKNPRAIEYAYQLISQIGLPSEIDPTANGMMIWKSELLSNTCFDRIEIRTLNDSSKNITYVFVNYDLPISKYVEVMDLSKLIVYDPLRKQLRACAPTLELCVAILTLAVQIGEGQISLNYTIENNLLPSYLRSSQQHASYTRLYEYLSYSLKHQQGIPEMREPRNDFPMPLMAPLPHNIY